MQLENTFTVPAGIDTTWAAFNDPKQVAPCFPGATLEEQEGDNFVGTVKVKLGPISLTYKGKGTFIERDEAGHKVVIEASGRDSRGNGTANATVTGTLVPDGDAATAVRMVTDMTITGRPAQFGRGVIADVSEKIIGQFASCLATKLGDGAAVAEAPAATPRAAPAPAQRQAGATSAPATEAPAAETPAAEAPAAETAAPVSATAPAAEGAPADASANGSAPQPGSLSAPVRSEIDAIDLLDSAGAPILKRLAPILVGVLAVVAFVVIRRLRHRSR